ncbi:MAG TPA: hypothetical protein VMF09_04700 [Solirubrobacteraceae bacterium]|nr:hypothetical protein [Solirubrobacteraceae bacterium]
MAARFAFGAFARARFASAFGAFLGAGAFFSFAFLGFVCPFVSFARLFSGLLRAFARLFALALAYELLLGASARVVLAPFGPERLCGARLRERSFPAFGSLPVGGQALGGLVRPRFAFAARGERGLAGFVGAPFASASRLLCRGGALLGAERAIFGFELVQDSARPWRRLRERRVVRRALCVRLQSEEHCGGDGRPVHNTHRDDRLARHAFILSRLAYNPCGL